MDCPEKLIERGITMYTENIKAIYRKALRYRLNKENRNRLVFDRENPFSIISSNCVGGVILHELGLKFNTPTINLFFVPRDYLEFIQNLKYYTTEAGMVELSMDKKHNYPRGILDDKIVIHFLHYDSYSQAYSKWMDRCNRINFENLIFVLSERDGLTSEDVRKFCVNNYGGGVNCY